jgi:hypothetical protein
LSKMLYINSLSLPEYKVISAASLTLERQLYLGGLRLIKYEIVNTESLFKDIKHDKDLGKSLF